MKLITELKLTVKKGVFPQLIGEIFKNACEVQNLRQLESTNRREIYSLEIVYYNRDYFNRFISIIKSSPERFTIVSMCNILEEKVKGGLLVTGGKMPIENTSDYEMNLLGATDLILDRIKSGEGRDYTGIGRNVCLLNCLRQETSDSGELPERAYEKYAIAERDSVILGRFTECNPVPLIVQYKSEDDLQKTIQKISGSFSCIRLISVDDQDIDLIQQLVETVEVPLISRDIIDIPLYLLTLIIMVVVKHKLSLSDTTVGLIGLDMPGRMLTKLLCQAGVMKVLGYDSDERNMFTFESAGGLATTIENTLGNADIIICVSNELSSDAFEAVRPGQFFLSMISEGQIDWMSLEKAGVREFVQCDYHNLAAIFPGIVKGVIASRKSGFSEKMLIHIATELVKLINKDYKFPELFGDVHEKVSSLVQVFFSRELD